MRTMLSIVLMIAVSHQVFAVEDEEREVLLPYVTLVQPPTLPKIEAKDLPEDRVDEIKHLIGELADLKSEDIGLLKSPVWGQVFLPIGDFGAFFERAENKFKSFEPLKKLVEIGPDALPFLLEALKENRPTQLVIKAEESRGAISGGMAFDEVLHGNPANPTERYILKLNRVPFTASIRRDKFFVENDLESYRVKVGDVCLVIIGQITGRDYECLFHNHVKSLGVVVNSPVHRKSTHDKVRQIWKSKNPRQKVFESLLLDFSTRGVLQGNSLDDWDIGNDFQVAATMRLLYYYPEESAETIAKRLSSLDVSDADDFFDQCVRNGIRADHLIEASSWSKNKHIQAALASLAKAAKERGVVKALKRAGFDVPAK